MKSYLQGMITGGILVFATIIFMGQTNNSFPDLDKPERFKLLSEVNSRVMVMMDTASGNLWVFNRSDDGKSRSDQKTLVWQWELMASIFDQ